MPGKAREKNDVSLFAQNGHIIGEFSMVVLKQKLCFLRQTEYIYVAKLVGLRAGAERSPD
jgi:hypothetical protein